MDLRGQFKQLVEQQPFDQFQTTKDKDMAKWISQHGGAQIALVGDSIAYGINSQLNQGVEPDAAKGLNSAAILRRIQTNPKLKNAKTAVISAGSNDIVGGKGNPAALTANLAKIRDELNADKYVWIVPYDNVAADAVAKFAQGRGDATIALSEFPSNDGVHPSNYASLAGRIRSMVKTTAQPRADAAPAAQDATPTSGGAAQPKLAADADPKVAELQQALVAAGFNLPKHGIDGKMGPETKDAILRAEQALGRSPTGQVTAQELARLKGGASQTEPAALKPEKKADAERLKKSLSAIEQALNKIKKESREPTAVEEMQQWRDLVEAQPKIPVGAKFDRATGNWYTVSPTGAKTYIGGLTQQPQSSKLSRFAKNFGSRALGAGSAGKIAARGALRAVPYVGWAMLAKDAWDAWQDVSSEEREGMDPELVKAIEENLPVLQEFAEDEALMQSLDQETQSRLRRVLTALEDL